MLGGFTWRLEVGRHVAERPRVAIRDLQGVAGFRIDDMESVRKATVATRARRCYLEFMVKVFLDVLGLVVPAFRTRIERKEPHRGDFVRLHADLGCRVQGSRFSVQCSRFRVQGSGLRVEG